MTDSWAAPMFVVMSERFREALASGGLVFDGAMGTALHELGIPYDQSFDRVSLCRPELVQRVHERHLRAGADVLSTNSFGANRFRLLAHSLEAHTAAINRAAVSIARGVARGNAFVCGAIGPTGLTRVSIDAAERASVRAAFLEQCVALIEGGVDAVLLETFRQPEELRLALDAAREAAGDAVPIIASVSFDQGGDAADGTTPELLAQQLASWGASALGVNCAEGPAAVFETAARMFGAGLPIVAQPNAGLPERVAERFVYRVSPDDFGIYARRLFELGVNAVGGCCGTTAAHIECVRTVARMFARRAARPAE